MQLHPRWLESKLQPYFIIVTHTARVGFSFSYLRCKSETWLWIIKKSFKYFSPWNKNFVQIWMAQRQWTLFWCRISAVGLARPSKKLVKVKLVKLVTQFLKVRDPPPPSPATCHGHAHPPNSGLRQEPGLDFERPHSGPELIFCDRKLFSPQILDISQPKVETNCRNMQSGVH